MISEQIRKDLVLAAMAFHRMAEIEWSSSRGLDDFVAFDFSMTAVRAYPAERLAPFKRQKTDDDPVFPVLLPVIDVQCLPGMSRKKIFNDERDYKQYLGVLDYGAGFPSEVEAEVVDNINDIVDQKPLWQTGRGTFFSAIDLWSSPCRYSGLQRLFRLWMMVFLI